MKTILDSTYLIAAALVAALIFSPTLQAQAPVISNVVAQQRPNSKLVDITYDLESFSPDPIYVAAAISELGDGNYNLPLMTLIGDVGNTPVPAGTGKKITWSAGQDWDGNFTNQAVAQVTATSPPGDFVLIPSGNFLMGDPFFDQSDDEQPMRSVFVSGFFMQTEEVSNSEMAEVMNWALSQGLVTQSGASLVSTEETPQPLFNLGEVELAWTGYLLLVVPGKENFPFSRLTWYGAAAFTNFRSIKEGKTPCYDVGGTWACDFNQNGYRLPTEAEWEKAARGGLAGKRFPWGGDTISHDQANHKKGSQPYDLAISDYFAPYYDGTPPYTNPGGFLPANGYGLFDMDGNVSEWCNDWYGEDYYGESGNTNNPRGPNSGTIRILRGGSWFYDSVLARSASRRGLAPVNPNHSGVRLVLDQ